VGRSQRVVRLGSRSVTQHLQDLCPPAFALASAPMTNWTLDRSGQPLKALGRRRVGIGLSCFQCELAYGLPTQFARGQRLRVGSNYEAVAGTACFSAQQKSPRGRA